MAGINCGSELFPEVMRYFSLRSLLNWIWSTFPGGAHVENCDERLWRPITNEFFDEKGSNTNLTSRRRYKSLSNLFSQQFESSSSTMKYIERCTLLDLFLGTISVFFNLDENNRFKTLPSFNLLSVPSVRYRCC